jgi:uncharacterized protein
MNRDSVIKQTAENVKKTLSGEGSGHDWWHVYRVWNLSKKIAKKEKADIYIVELAALLHDIADWKFNNGDDKIGAKTAREWLKNLKIDEKIIDEVTYIIDNISYKGGTNKIKMRSIEGMVVQDADRLDAMGAIGIARAFAFGGNTNAKMHDPKIKPMTFKDFQDFKKRMKTNTVINHFYEKLLLIKDLMNTETAKKIAKGRHKYLENFLKKFYAEWEGRE